MTDAFEPVIIGFTCNWCSYRAADTAGTSRIKYPPNVRLIRLMCSGRVDPTFVLKALSEGADGVLITGCHPGDCHYIEQNYKTLRRHRLLQRTLSQLGIEPERVRLSWSSAARARSLRRPSVSSWKKCAPLGPLAWPSRPVPESRVARNRRNDRGLAMQTEIRHVLGGGLRRLRDRRAQHQRQDSRSGCELRRGLLACGDGREIQRRRSNGGRQHPAHPVQRRDPHRRERADGETAAAQIASAGGLRFVRRRRLHPRSGQSLQQESLDTAFSTLSTENPQDIRPQTVYQVPRGCLDLPAVRTVRTLDQVVAWITTCRAVRPKARRSRPWST